MRVRAAIGKVLGDAAGILEKARAPVHSIAARVEGWLSWLASSHSDSRMTAKKERHLACCARVHVPANAVRLFLLYLSANNFCDVQMTAIEI